MSTQEQTAMNKWQRAEADALANLEKRAAKLADLRSEYQALQDQLPGLQAQRLELVAEGQPTARLDAQVEKAQKRAADLSGAMALRSAEIKTALARIARVERVEIARATWAFKMAEARRLAAEANRLYAAWKPVFDRAQAARFDADNLSSLEANAVNIVYQAEWVEAQYRRLVGDASTPTPEREPVTA